MFSTIKFLSVSVHQFVLVRDLCVYESVHVPKLLSPPYFRAISDSKHMTFFIDF